MSDAFKNVRLSQRVEVNASGGPGFKTTIIETASGDEYRNINWSRQRGRWDVGYTDDHARIQDIIAFFQVMRGRAYGFRFKDWSDYQVDNVFAVGDGSTKTFQALKVYTAGGHAYSRVLTRLVGPVVVTVNGASASPAVNLDTGQIVFSTAPAVDAQIGIRCEFDVPVRFDVDELPVTMITQNLSRLDSVPLVEIRDHGNA